MSINFGSPYYHAKVVLLVGPLNHVMLGKRWAGGQTMCGLGRCTIVSTVPFRKDHTELVSDMSMRLLRRILIDR